MSPQVLTRRSFIAAVAGLGTSAWICPPSIAAAPSRRSPLQRLTGQAAARIVTGLDKDPATGAQWQALRDYARGLGFDWTPQSTIAKGSHTVAGETAVFTCIDLAHKQPAEQTACIIDIMHGKKRYMALLIAQPGKPNEAPHIQEFTVQDGKVVPAHSWWTCFWDALMRHGADWVKAAFSCTPSIATSLATFFWCIFGQVGFEAFAVSVQCIGQ